MKLPGKPSGPPALVAPSRVVVAGSSFLRAYDVKTGALHWEVPQGATAVVPGAGGNLYAVRPGEVACYAPDGEALGSKPAPDTPILPPVTSEGTLYLAGERTVTAVSLTSGKLEWQAEVSRPLALALDGNAGVLVVADHDRLRGFSVERGSQSWEVPLPARPVGLVTGAGKVVLACADGQLQVFDGHGQLQWGARPEAQLTAGPGLAGTTVLVAGERGLHLYDGLGKETLAATLPAATQPPVAQAPLVFVPGASSLAAVPFRP